MAVGLSDEAAGNAGQAREVALAVPAVQVRIAGNGTVKRDRLIRIHAVVGVAEPLVIEMTHMGCRGSRFMPAAVGHRRPGELEWQENQQHDGDPTTHDARV